MADYRLQVAVWYDSIAPKDAMVINPTFKSGAILGTGLEGLVDDLCAAVDLKVPATCQTRVRAYKLPYVRGAGHEYEKQRNVGAAPVSTLPRELAMCLSYYSGENKPRRRGRLYIPLQFLGLAITGNRPSVAQITEVMSWRTVFEDLGGVGDDWTVYSQASGASHSVTNVWCDDEFDVVRSRGLRGTTRQQATTSEGGVTRVALTPGALDAPPALDDA